MQLFLFLFFTVIHATTRCQNELGPWIERSPIPSFSLEGSNAVVNGKMYIICGFNNSKGGVTDTVHIYNPEKDQWSIGAKAPLLLSHSPAAFDSRYIYLAGGFVGRSPGYPTDQVWRYDTVRDEWSELPKLPFPRASGAMVFASSKLHLISGLADRFHDLPIHWVLNLNSTHKWENASIFSPHPRNHFQAVSMGNFIYLIGGQFNHDNKTLLQDVNLVDMYNIRTREWTPKTPLPAPRSHAEGSTIEVNGKIMVIGGRNDQYGSYDVSTVLEYDPQWNEWIYLRDLPRHLIGGNAGFFRNITIDGSRGDFVVVSGGGLHYDRPTNNTYVSKVMLVCKEMGQMQIIGLDHADMSGASGMLVGWFWKAFLTVICGVFIK